ncbi:RNA polymerase factor sigma-54 [Paenibacillus gansuensis]|uniref:RNA polymerase factor sigma-54 n=1 Tax=Paenibacillus gansuensis TaxID=306542 RepID=A0ABW5P990_9BACL
MVTGVALHLEQGMRLALTPEMHQSIYMLQLSHQELSSYLYEQAESNPLLEIGEVPAAGSGSLTERHRSRAGQNVREVRQQAGEAGAGSFRPSGGKPGREPRAAARGGGASSDPLSSVSGRGETLEESLLSQLRIAGIPDSLYGAAAFLAGSLNESGYLAEPLDALSAQLGCPLTVTEAALRRLQEMEPAGVGARDLRECLLLQIARDPGAPAAAWTLADRHLPELAQGRYERIAAAMGVTPEAVRAAAGYIRGLDPRPGAALGQVRSEYVIPDARVELDPAGEAGGSVSSGGTRRFTVRLLRGLVPQIKISETYNKLPERMSCQPTAAYIRDMSRSASMLLHNLEHREQTLYRVIEAVFSHQEGFLTDGPAGLKPLNLKQIAEQLGFHESTVSRAAQHKYVETPWGVHPLKFFFSTGIQTAEGSAASNVTVKARIRKLIDKENKGKPLSDQMLCDLLDREGIRLSRRTVAKYREEMKILPSVLRKSV